MRSEADYRRRQPPPRVFQEGGAFNRPQSPRRAVRAGGFFAPVLSALSKLRRLRRAQKSPKQMLGALKSVEVRSGFEPL